MTQQSITSEARERVLDAAAKLFAERGYAAVTLRDIATAIGIRHTSLYHHAPGGKEDLFIEVTERHLAQHRQGLTQAMAAAAPDLRQQLYAAAAWFLRQPPVDLVRMTYADMPAIAPAAAERLAALALHALITPIKEVLSAASDRGEIAHEDWGLIAGGLVGTIQSFHAMPEHAFHAPTVTVKSRLAAAEKWIDLLLRGLAKS